jgi:hypothetical protein
MKIPYLAWTIIAIIVVSVVNLAFFAIPPISAGTVISVSLLWCLVIGVGIGGIYTFRGQVFRGQVFRGDEVARRIGWQPGSPFQREVAFANLAIGVAGIGCLVLEDGFWLATIVVAWIFLFCDGLGHIHETKTHGNAAELNTGAILAWDLLFPVALVVLFVGSPKMPL